MLRDMINRNLVSVEPNEKVSQVAKLMADHNVGAVLVVSKGKPFGIVTDRDIVLRCFAGTTAFQDLEVEKIATHSPVQVKETEGLYDCIRKMSEAKVRRIPVVDESGNAVTILSFSDVFSLLARELNDLAQVASPYVPPKEGVAGKAA